MTDPQLAQTFDWGRMYARTRGGTLEVPSITTILDALSQDMEWWEALCATRLAMEHADRLVDITRMPNGPERWSRERAAKDWLMAAAERDRDESSVRGDFVHDYAEAFGLHSLGRATADDVMAEQRRCEQGQVMDYVASFHSFWMDYNPRVLQPEATVWNAAVGYAGTTDLLCEIDVKGRSVLAVVDYKCTTDDTLVLMADRTQRRAADLHAGDMVLAWDADASRFEPRTIYWVGDNGEQETVTLTALGGREAQVTLNHPVLVRRNGDSPQWVFAANVRPGDLVRCDVRDDPGGDVTLGARDGYQAALTLPGGAEAQVPVEVLASASPARAGFVSGYLDTDGIVSGSGDVVPTVHWTCPSAMFAHQFRDLLGSLDVVAHVTALTASDHVVVVSDPAAVTRLANLAHSQVRDTETRLAGLRGKADPDDAYGWIPVLAADRHVEPVHTVAVEVEGLHTHVTGGLVTHNTKKALRKRNGQPKDKDLRDFTGMQLAAAAFAEEIWVPGATPEQDAWMPFPYEVEVGLAVALAPDGYVVRQYPIHNPLYWDTFRALVQAWRFKREGVALMSARLTGPDDIVPLRTPRLDPTVRPS